MMPNPKIQANTRYAFACIALMMLMFLIFVVLTAVPLGLSMGHQIAAIRVSLYALVLFAVLGGIFSIRVAVLRKNSAKVIK
ncbi:cytochrome b6 [Neisseria sp. CCUG12390]|uniref:cytochrome b6 n=1 Tax=Neisseria sp. CCUG12390 TaxID=3392035 RepID=UPI003A0FEB94